MAKTPRCNWEYTGDYDSDKYGMKSAIYKSDCGETIKWTRSNKIGLLLKQYHAQAIPQGTDFYVKCPYCGKILNIYNPFDDGETWRE